MIIGATGADSFEILPEEDYYPYTYDELTDVAKREQNQSDPDGSSGCIHRGHPCHLFSRAGTCSEFRMEKRASAGCRHSGNGEHGCCGKLCCRNRRQENRRSCRSRRGGVVRPDRTGGELLLLWCPISCSFTFKNQLFFAFPSLPDGPVRICCSSRHGGSTSYSE